VAAEVEHLGDSGETLACTWPISRRRPSVTNTASGCHARRNDSTNVIDGRTSLGDAGGAIGSSEMPKTAAKISFRVNAPCYG
jgi:hypothetical protein